MQFSREKLANNLTNLLKINELTISDLAKDIDVPIATLHRILIAKTQKPKITIIKKIAEVFSITEDQLLGIEEIEWGKMDTWLNLIIISNQIIPLFSWDLDEKGNLKDAPKSPEQIILTSECNPALFALKLQDQSIAPSLPSNSILICYPFKKIRNDSLVIVKIRNHTEVYLRKLIIDIDGQYVKPINNENHKELLYKLTK